MSKPRIKADYNIRHYIPYIFNRLKHKYPELTKVQINKIINLYYEKAVYDLAEGYSFNMQNRLGTCYVEKEKRKVTFDPETNTIINTVPVNIVETLKLWKEYPEYKKVKYVRYNNDHSQGYVYSLKFTTYGGNYKNKSLYTIKYSRSVKSALNLGIMEKRTNALTKKIYKNE